MSADDLPRCSNKSDVLPDALCGWLPGHRGECTFVSKERKHLRGAIEARDAEIERLREVVRSLHEAGIELVEEHPRYFGVNVDGAVWGLDFMNELADAVRRAPTTEGDTP